MSYLITPSGDQFGHSTFFDHCNSQSYGDEMQPHYNYIQYAKDERLVTSTVADYNCSSFAIHQLLGLATRSAVNGMTSQQSDRQRTQQFMMSYADDAIATSDSACSYGRPNQTSSSVVMSRYRRPVDQQSDVIARGSCSYNRIRQYDDVNMTSCDDVKRRHHNYLTAIGA